MKMQGMLLISQKPNLLNSQITLDVKKKEKEKGKTDQKFVLYI